MRDVRTISPTTSGGLSGFFGTLLCARHIYHFTNYNVGDLHANINRQLIPVLTVLIIEACRKLNMLSVRPDLI